MLTEYGELSERSVGQLALAGLLIVSGLPRGAQLVPPTRYAHPSAPHKLSPPPPYCARAPSRPHELSPLPVYARANHAVNTLVQIYVGETGCAESTASGRASRRPAAATASLLIGACAPKLERGDVRLDRWVHCESDSISLSILSGSDSSSSNRTSACAVDPIRRCHLNRDPVFGIGRSRRPPQRDLPALGFPLCDHWHQCRSKRFGDIVSSFHALTIPGGRWLCPRANAPRPALPPGPSALGAYVTISSALMDDAIASELLA